MNDLGIVTVATLLSYCNDLGIVCCCNDSGIVKRWNDPGIVGYSYDSGIVSCRYAHVECFSSNIVIDGWEEMAILNFCISPTGFKVLRGLVCYYSVCSVSMAGGAPGSIAEAVARSLLTGSRHLLTCAGGTFPIIHSHTHSHYSYPSPSHHPNIPNCILLRVLKGRVHLQHIMNYLIYILGATRDLAAVQFLRSFRRYYATTLPNRENIDTSFP